MGTKTFKKSFKAENNESILLSKFPTHCRRRRDKNFERRYINESNIDLENIFDSIYGPMQKSFKIGPKNHI